eukprot:COSAG06_NODE_1713_length_8629_cov_25.894842_7_plen_174_part_00
MSKTRLCAQRCIECVCGGWQSAAHIVCGAQSVQIITSRRPPAAVAGRLSAASATRCMRLGAAAQGAAASRLRPRRCLSRRVLRRRSCFCSLGRHAASRPRQAEATAVDDADGPASHRELPSMNHVDPPIYMNLGDLQARGKARAAVGRRPSRCEPSPMVVSLRALLRSDTAAG